MRFCKFFVTPNNDLFHFIWSYFLSFNEVVPGILLDVYKSLEILTHIFVHCWEVTGEDKKLGESSISVFESFHLASEEKSVKSLFDKSVKDLKIKDFGSNAIKALKDKFKFEYQGIDLFLLTRDTIGPLEKFPSGPFYHAHPHKLKVDNITTSKSIVENTVDCIILVEKSIANEADTPNNSLMRFLVNKQDLASKVIDRVENYVKMIDFGGDKEETTAKQSMTKKIYFQVLLKMLIGEETRLNQSDFSVLLNNENFNKSLLLCSAETVFFAYNKREVMDSIGLLKLFGLEAFELCKVIESFVVHCTWLSPVFKRHMRYVEEKCFDYLSWREGSSLFERLKGDTPFAVTNVTETPKRKPVTIVAESPMRNGSEKGKSPSLDFFFRKSYKLIQGRIIEMCSFFENITTEVQDAISSVIQYILQTKSHLMMNRHLDQIIICSIFAVFKIHKKGSKDLFRDLVYQYKCLCETKRSIAPVETLNVVWNVSLKSFEYGDIIAFYNKVFINEVKPYLYKEDKTPIQIPMSPSRVKVATNVFMSPLRTPNTPSAFTPKTRSLYAFGTGFTEKSMEGSGYMIPEKPVPIVPVAGIKRVLTFEEGNQKDDFIQRKLSKMEEK